MKNFLILLMALVALCTTGCLDDDFEPMMGNPSKNYPSVIGTWADIDKDADGEFGLSWSFDKNGRATQRAWLIMYGVTLRDVKENFSYKYDGKNITTTDSDGNITIHSVSISGNTMIFGDGVGGHFTLIKQ